jgi:hypothetical protein
MKTLFLLPFLLIATIANAETETAMIKGFSSEMIQKDQYEDQKAEVDGRLIKQAINNAISNCSNLDGTGLLREEGIVASNSASIGEDYLQVRAEASMGCDVLKPKQMPLLGVSAVANGLEVTNLTNNGRSALLAVSKEADNSFSESCLQEAVSAANEIAKDTDLQTLKAEIEKKIGPFSVIYNLDSGISKEERPEKVEGALNFFVFNPEQILRQSKKIDFNNLWAETFAKEITALGTHIVYDTVNCSPAKDSIRRYLQHMKEVLYSPEDRLKPADMEERTSHENVQ